MNYLPRGVRWTKYCATISLCLPPVAFLSSFRPHSHLVPPGLSGSFLVFSSIVSSVVACVLVLRVVFRGFHCRSFVHQRGISGARVY
jgi:hypothetical protein